MAAARRKHWLVEVGSDRTEAMLLQLVKFE